MSLPAPWLLSARLSLRRFVADDLQRLAGWYGDAHVARHVGGIKTPEQCATLLHTRILADYERHPGLGMWLTCRRSDGLPLGFHLLCHVRGESHIQVGYVLGRSHWGQGYATEMALALLHYGFAVRTLPRVCAIADCDHGASLRVLEKCGLRRDGERVFAQYGPTPLAWFEAARAAWLARHAQTDLCIEPARA